MKNGVVTLIALSLFVAAPAVLAKDDGKCKEKDVAGSYLISFPAQVQDPHAPPGNYLDRIYLTQINLNEDGNAMGYSTALPDLHISEGTNSPYIGSWACRKDGKLILSYFTGLYYPTGTGDIQLVATIRRSSLYEVVDKDTIMRVQAISRIYNTNEDPADPNGGYLDLANEDFGEFTYERLVPSDADLTP